MLRPAKLVALALVAVALLAAGCGESSPSAEPQPPPPPTAAPPAPPSPPARPSPTFRKDDLPRVALGPKNAPSGLAYLEAESGPMALEDVFVLPQQRAQLRRLGFEAMHDGIFVSKAPRSDQRVSQRIWLFRNRGGAMAWLDKTREDAASRQFSELTAPVLGDESWAGRGLIQVAGGQAITHAFRLGNTVHTVSMYGEVTPPTEAGAMAAAQAALAKARKG
jgi:hypothetical protein